MGLLLIKPAELLLFYTGADTFTSTVRAARILSSPISFFVTPRTSVTGGIFCNGRFPWRMIICLLFGLGFPPLS